MNFERARIGVLPTLALTGLSAVTVVSFRGVYSGWEFLPMMLTLVLAMHAVLALCRALRVHLLIATPLSMLVATSVIARGMYHDSVRFLVLPSRQTWHLATIDLKDAWHQFPNAIAPVPAANGFLLASAIAVALVAYAADTFAFRAYGRVEAVIPSGVLFTFVAALGTTGSEHDRYRIAIGTAWLLATCLSVALLRSTHNDLGTTWLGGNRRERTVRMALAATLVSLVTVTAAYAVAPHLPGAGRAALITPDGDEDDDPNEVAAISPIVDIKKRLVNRSNTVMFKVEADRSSYWHLTSLSGFDGERWTYDESFSKADGELDVTPLAGGDQVRQTFTIVQMGDGWVPAAYEAVALEGDSDFVYNAATGTLRLAGDDKLSAGLTYDVTSVLPTFSPEQLGAATSSSPPDQKYLEMPDDFPESLADVARSIVEGATTPYEQALALQNWFRDNFKYDQNVPRGNGDQAIQTFLNQRRGYCEQFAGTYAAFGRVLGLPTRVAVGFTPGVVEDGQFVVRGRNAHAWPEVWFDDLGWVLFEPTPNRGAPGATDYTGVAPEQDTRTGDDTSTADPDTPESTTTTTRPRTTTTVAGNVPRPTTAVPDITDAPPATSSGGGSVGGPWVVVLAVLALLAAWGYGLPLVATSWRLRRRGPTPADHVTAAWADAALALSLVGVDRRPGETPLEHAQRAAKVTGINATALKDLAHAATKAVYASTAVTAETAAQCDVWRHQIARAAHDRSTRTMRLRARFDPRIAGALR